MLARKVLASLASAAILALGSAGGALADGTWLDQPVISWNWAGRPIPAAPAADGAYSPADDPFCQQAIQQPSTPAARQVSAKGWTIVDDSMLANGVQQVLGTVGFDGMCRTQGYNFFIFVNGEFAGTTSPEPMYSRADGSGGPLMLESNRLIAYFGRYAPDDPLCCPSRPSTVIEYQLNRGAAGPVLTPTAYYSPGDVFPPERLSPALLAAIMTVYDNGFVPRDLESYQDDHALRVLIGVQTVPDRNDRSQAFFFLGDEYLGTDTAEPSRLVRFVDSDGTTVTLEYAVRQPGDEQYCLIGSGSVQVRYHWDGSHLIPLDPIPSLEARGPGQPCR